MQVGLDRVLESRELVASLRSERVGLLCHPASVSRSLEHIVSALARLEIFPTVLFGPEHGIEGQAQDMIAIGDDAPHAPTILSATRVRSLYGDSEAELSPRPEDLAGLDRVVIDLQDVGARYYTFVWSAVLMMRACAKAGVRVLVLDRPNPLGRTLEGRLHEHATFQSFVGLEPTAIRHGLTIGEIVAWRAGVEHVSRDLVHVLATRDLPDHADASAWDRPMVAPSPNMPNLETAWVYPGGCLLEGTNLSEGRGTTRPFLLWGAPWLEAERLVREARALDLHGVVLRPHVFEPMFHKYARERVRGIEVHVTERAAFEPVRTYAGLIAMCAHMHPEHFRFRTERYEYREDVPAIDLLVGGDTFRKGLVADISALDLARAVAFVGEAERNVFREAIETAKGYIH